MLRPRRNWTRGVAAQHASLSRWRSPVRIRSGPPSPAFPYAPSARPDGAFLCASGTAVASAAADPRRLCQTPARESTPLLAARRSASSLVARRGGGRRAAARTRRRRRAADRRRPPPSPAARAGRPRDRRPGDAAASASPAPPGPRRRPSPTARRPPATPAADRRRPDRAGHELPHRPPRATTAKEVAAILAGTSSRYEALELVDGEADAILAALGVDRPADHDRTSSSPRRGHPRRGPRQEPQAAGVPARRRGRARGPRPRLGRRGPVRGRSGEELADWPLTARLPAPGRRPTPTTRRRPGRCSPAATSCSIAASTRRSRSREGRRLPVRRRDGRHHRPLQGLLRARLGRAVHEADGRTPAPSGDLIKGADIADRELREPGAGQLPLPHHGHRLLGRPAAHRRPRQRRHRLRLARQQPHPRRRRRRVCSRRSRTSTKRGIKVSGAGKNLRPPASRRSSRPAGRRSRSSPTTRSPAATTRPRRRSAARRSGEGRQGGRRRRAQGRRRRRHRLPALGHRVRPDAVRLPAEAGRMIIDAGADMVIGNHAHWAAAMEVYEGKPIWYALGNFVFDQTWSEPTMEGITLELTFRGADWPRSTSGRTSSSTRPSRTSSTRPATAGRDGPGVHRLEGAAALVSARAVRGRVATRLAPRRSRRRGRSRAIVDLDPRLAQDVGLVRPASPPAVEPERMNGLSSLICVTCSWIASHFASSGAPETSIQVVIVLVRDQHLRGELLEFGDLLGRRVFGRRPEACWPSSSAVGHLPSRTEAGMACS